MASEPTRHWLRKRNVFLSGWQLSAFFYMVLRHVEESCGDFLLTEMLARILLWQCPHSMRRRVYVCVGRLSVCLSLCPIRWLHATRFSALTIVIYRPGSVAACDDFFDHLSDLLERVSMYTNLLIIVDINLNLDVRLDAHTIRFQQYLSEAHDLTQHVVGATHSLSHTLDVFITHAEQTVNSVSVDPPVLSDHFQIVGVLAARLPHPHTGTRQMCRCWRQLDLDELKHDIQQSVLITDPPTDVDEYFICYNDVLCLLLDKHVPVKSAVVRLAPR